MPRQLTPMEVDQMHKDRQTILECSKFFPEPTSAVSWSEPDWSQSEIQECISDFQKLRELTDRRIGMLVAKLGPVGAELTPTV